MTLFLSAGTAAQAQTFGVSTLDQDVGADAGVQSFVLADVNKDNMADLVAINRLNGSTKVLVRLAQTDGTFDENREFDLMGEEEALVPVALAVADVSSEDGSPDGNPDIIVATQATEEGVEDGVIVLLRGSGDGQFQQRPGEFAALDTDLVAIVVDDLLFGDGELDIAAVDVDGTVFVIENKAGFFDADSAQEFDAFGMDMDTGVPIDILSGDFDGDGSVDIAVLDQGDEGATAGNVWVLLHDDEMIFDDDNPIQRSASTEVDEDELPVDFDTHDLDGDGIDEVVVYNDGEFGNLFMLVLGGVELQRRAALTAAANGTSLTLGDFNGDGDFDVVLTHQSGTALVLGNGSPDGFPDSGGEGLRGPLSGRATAAGDINGDQKLDFAVLRPGGTGFSVAINGAATPTVGATTPTTPPTSALTGTPTQTRPTNTPTPTATATRIPTVPYSNCSVQLRQASGQGASNALQRPSALASGDIDGNATQDVVVADREQGKVFALLLDPSRFDRRSDGCVIPIDPSPSALPGVTPTPAAFYTELDNISQPLDVALGQLSRPEQLTTDLAVVGSTGLSLFFGNGTGGFGNRLNFTNLGSDARSVVIADIDLDGIRDVVVALHDQRKLVIFKGGGNRTFTEALRLDTIDDPVALVVDRIDFDEYPDLAFVGDRVSTARIYLSPGKLIGVPPPPTPTPEPTPNLTVILTGVPTDLATEDFNRDGTIDLVTTLANGQFVLLTTARSGDTVTVTASTSQTTGGLPMAVGAARFDDNTQDLEPDVVVADFLNDDALFFYKSGGTFSGQSPVLVGGRPVTLSVADFDNDRRPDVLVAGETGGTLTLLRSAVAPSTPTPTHTFTVTPTPTVTPTQPTGTPTRSATATESALPSRTPTLTPRNTPKPGTFELSDNGCAVVPTDGSGSWAWFAMALGFVVLRTRGSRDPR